MLAKSSPIEHAEEFVSTFADGIRIAKKKRICV
jgi:hypothetical protein